MKILFLCVANSARSQMAEGLARALLGPTVEVHSAGSNPSKVNPLAIKVLEEVGINISGHHSKSVDDLTVKHFDYVITLCAEEICPLYLGAGQKLHWGFLDPASPNDVDIPLFKFREVRDGIMKRIMEFKVEQGLK
jgi:arsenate reductase (thioredoxin)